MQVSGLGLGMLGSAAGRQEHGQQSGRDASAVRIRDLVELCIDFGFEGSQAFSCKLKLAGLEGGGGGGGFEAIGPSCVP